jgi:2-polyprenyl-3-methyl-5-hydroxy-6-metoxy-1,4-benzoquinol methylase
MSHQIGEMVKSANPCKICGGDELRIVAIKGRHSQDLTTAICTGCGLTHSHPIPSEAELKEYYREQYRSDYKSAYTPKRRHIVRYARNAAERINRLQQFVESGAKLVDVGSGSGEFIYAAKLAGFDVMGVEPHEGYSEYTRNTFEVNVLTSRFQDADIEAESLDAVTLHHVLKHLQYPLTALVHISHWLKYGGLIMIDVPDIENTIHSPSTRFHYAHIYNFNHATLQALLFKAGFDLVEHQMNKAGTIMAAKKVRQADYDMQVKMPENYQKLWDIFMQGSNAPQYSNKKPVNRMFIKLYRSIKEFLRGIIQIEPKAIVQKELKNLVLYKS